MRPSSFVGISQVLAMVSRRPIKVRLQDYPAWQIGVVCLLGLGAFLMVGWWSLAPTKYKTQRSLQLAKPSTSEEPSSFRPPFRMPDFDVPDLTRVRPNRPASKGGAELERFPQFPSPGQSAPPVGLSGKLTPMPQMESPLMPPLEIPGSLPGTLPDVALHSMPGMSPSPDQLSPNFQKKMGGFVGPNPFALMPQGAGPDPAIFARQPQAEVPSPPKLPGMPAPPKGYMDKVNSAVDGARRRLSEPHPGDAPPASFVEPTPQPTAPSRSRELPQG